MILISSSLNYFTCKWLKWDILLFLTSVSLSLTLLERYIENLARKHTQQQNYSGRISAALPLLPEFRSKYSVRCFHPTQTKGLARVYKDERIILFFFDTSSKEWQWTLFISASHNSLKQRKNIKSGNSTGGRSWHGILHTVIPLPCNCVQGNPICKAYFQIIL